MKKLHTFVVLAYKESKYLEECIKSVLNQDYKSNVIIATSTPNKHIDSIAKKYKLNVIENPNKGKGIGADFDFALSCGNTELVTIAHQDDVYDYSYSSEIIKKYNENPKSIIIFSDYYEIKNGQKVYKNTNLRVKRILLLPLRVGKLKEKRFWKRRVLSFGCPICCPAVTFAKSKVAFPLFDCGLKCNVDWNAWEKLSKEDGSFTFVNKNLMGHRVHEESETTSVIKENGRTKEDLILLNRFWPKPISEFISKIYAKSEKSNAVK
jgi:glycosyltransferase involved in cell wall biosynthesis